MNEPKNYFDPKDIRWGEGSDHYDVDELLKERDALAARVEELGGMLERPEPPGAWVSEVVYLKTRDDYEAKIKQLEKDRDFYVGASISPPGDRMMAEITRLREALEKIRDWKYGMKGAVREIAEDALKEASDE